jgi:hypothetical protein
MKDVLVAYQTGGIGAVITWVGIVTALGIVGLVASMCFLEEWYERKKK